MKKAIVTGAGRGIGRAITEKLSSVGFEVVAVARTSADLQGWAFPERVHAFAADVTDEAHRRDLHAFCLSRILMPDVLVNNAGAYLPDRVVGPSVLLENNLEVNLIQVREITSLFWDYLTSVNGHVFNVVSVLGREIRPEAASYTLAKHALAAYNRLLVAEGKKSGVKVTGLFPASVYTSAWEGAEDINPAQLISSEDVAHMLEASLHLSAAAVSEEIHIGCMTLGF